MAVCGPILGLAPIVDAYRGHWSADCLAFNESVIDWLGRHPSVRYVVLASPFAQYLDPANAYLVDGRVTGVDGQRFALALRATLARLATMGIRPVVFAPPPNNGVSNGRCLVYATLFGDDLAVCDFAPDSVLDAHRRAIEQLRALDGEFEVVWLDAAICAGGTCRSSMGDVFVFGKGSHLSHEGAALLGRRMGFFRAITGASAPVAQPVVDGATKP